MALRDQLNVSTRAELYNYVMQSDQVLTALGITTAGDIPAELWYYAATSTATDNGTTVIKPTAVPSGNPGRYVRWIQEADWNYINNKPTFSTVATSGDYNDLSNKPNLSVYYLNSNPSGYISGISSGMISAALGYTPVNPNGTNLQYIAGDGSKVTFPSIPAAQVNCDWNSVSGVSQLLNKPTLAAIATSGSYSDLTGAPTTLSGYGITDGVTTSALTSGLAGKENTITAGTTAQYWRGDKSWQTLNTSAVTEGSNLYYTDTRARAAVSLTTTGSGAASYNNSTGVLNVPTPSNSKRVETYLGTTDASGNYTVTYGTAFSTIPDVQPQLQAGTASQVARITASSTTGFTVNVTNRASVTLLGIEVLLAATTPVNGASVGVLVTSR